MKIGYAHLAVRYQSLTQSIYKPGLHTDRDYCFALLLRKLFAQSSSSSVRPRTLRMLVIDLSGLLIRLSCRIAQEKSTRTGPELLRHTISLVELHTCHLHDIDKLLSKQSICNCSWMHSIQ